MKDTEPRSFGKERRIPRPIRDGAWESVIMAVKEELPLTLHETTGPGDSDFWIEIEDRATIKPNQACMDFYIHNIGHRTLAELIVFSFQTVRTATGMGDVNKETKRLLTDRVSNKLLPYYPPRYRAKFG